MNGIDYSYYEGYASYQISLQRFIQEVNQILRRVMYLS